MHITYWSDYACPYCYIGISRIKRILKETGLYESTVFERKSFQLRKGELSRTCPSCSKVRDELNSTHFQKKYKLSASAASEQFDLMHEMGLQEGLDIHYGTAPLILTEDAHRLVKFAEDKKGPKIADAIAESLFYLYLSKNIDISDKNILTEIGEAADLNSAELSQLMNSDEYGAEVMMDGLKADMLGIHLIPHFIVNGKYAIEGVATPELIKKTLSAAL